MRNHGISRAKAEIFASVGKTTAFAWDLSKNALKRKNKRNFAARPQKDPRSSAPSPLFGVRLRPQRPKIAATELRPSEVAKHAPTLVELTHRAKFAAEAHDNRQLPLHQTTALTKIHRGVCPTSDRDTLKRSYLVSHAVSYNYTDFAERAAKFLATH